MADISPTGREITAPTDRLRLRRAELELEQLKVSIFTKEVRLDELALSIEKEQESINSSNELLKGKETDLKKLADELAE